MKVARGLFDRLADDFLDENMAGYAWRRALIARVSRHSDVIIFTMWIVAIYRIGSYIPVLGVNAATLALLNDARSVTFGQFELFDVVTGNNFARVSIFALGINPYIYASTYVQRAAFLWRVLRSPDAARPEGPWSIRVTGIVAFLLCVVQASRMGAFMESQSGGPAGELVYWHGATLRFMVALTLTSGTSWLIWLSDRITRRGIANGMILVFLAGIIAGLPGRLPVLRAEPVSALMLLAVAIGFVGFIARGYRRAVEAA